MRMRGDVALRGGSKGEGKRANSADLGLQKAKNPALSVSQAFIQVSGFGTAYEKAQSTCLFKEDENKVRIYSIGQSRQNLSPYGTWFIGEAIHQRIGNSLVVQWL
ncbi:hypothetical protein JEQ12_017519 [Ovis aries]|uniref:Uncharacterized protein n=1 Tax=Ovis aries TaxID=9940 RepID=A0A836D4P4_SHEEP|nr:hypothetical protein JEQ12_017519 [Ovis aries]